MKWTRALVEQEAQRKGLEPIEVQGIPSPFIYKFPDIQVGERIIKGQYVVYVPMTDKVERAYDLDILLDLYKQATHGKK